MSLCTTKDCPAGKFLWGNLASLNHENLDKMVLDFWYNYYSTNRMFLAVQSQQTTDEMVELIHDLFSKIPTNNLSTPKSTISQEPFCLETFHKIYKIVSVGSINKITFVWFLPSVLKLYKIKPLEYIAWIVGHEGRGSLINYLRKFNYAMELDTGVEDDFYNNSIYCLFTISIELTDLGLKNVDTVIELTFSYLNLIKQQGISEDIFKQIQILAENDFNLSENKNALDHVIELSLNMMNYDEEDYLGGSVLYYEYSPESIKDYLKLMTVDRVALFIFAKKFDNSDSFLIDPIFGTNYINEDFTKELENKWSTVQPHPFFKIPSENQYISTDFSILPQSTDDIKYPIKILEDKYIELWHKQDNHFKLPIGHIMLYFVTQMPSKSLENNVHLDLFLDSIVFLLNEDTYPLTMAQLNYTIRMYITGFELTFNGFNEKLPLLIDIVINCIKNYKSLITEEIFTMVKSQVINKLKNDQYDLNYVVSNMKKSLIQDPEWYIDNKLMYLEKLDYMQLLTFYEQLDNLYCRALIQGNINQTQAIQITKKVVNTLNYQPLDKKCFPVVLVKRLNPGERRVKLANYNTIDNNSMAYKYYQFDKCEINESMKYHVLQSIIEESAFNELRTKQCLGYDVQLNITSSYQHYGFYFTVAHQKNKFETKYVFSKMDEFIKQFWENFNEPDETDKARDALIEFKAFPDECLELEFNRNRKQILNGCFKFNRLELEIEALRNLKFDDVANLKHGFLSGNTLSIEIIGNNTIENEHENSPPMKKMCLEENKNNIYITDLNEFKKSLNPF